MIVPRKTPEKHGMYGTTVYLAWINMIQRCHNKKSTEYARYGLRGIIVCSEWRSSFIDFYDHVGDKPHSSYSLDRKDYNGDYEPGNVRWASKREQSINQRMGKNNTSGYRGVSIRKETGKWRSYISFDNTRYYFGEYPTPEEAAYIRDQVALQLFGDDVPTNLIRNIN